MTDTKKKIRVGIVGAGNCCSSLIQGLSYYSEEKPGLTSFNLVGYTPNDIDIVGALDINANKIGKPLTEAIFEYPNCARVFQKTFREGLSPIVEQNRILDGLAETTKNVIPLEVQEPNDSVIANWIRNNNIEIVINYLPVGSQKATEDIAEACLETGASLLNCIPIFIVSKPEWEKRFREKNIPCVGDDMKSQFGASILSQVLQECAYDRGMDVKVHTQVNHGGNMDFLNMKDTTRLTTKKISKENVIKSQLKLRGIDVDSCSIFAGPAVYLENLKDTKVAYLDISMRGFGDAEVTLNCRLEVQDSENSAGVVIDAIRYLKAARDMGMGGALDFTCSLTQKTPPVDLTFESSLKKAKEFTELYTNFKK